MSPIRFEGKLKQHTIVVGLPSYRFHWSLWTEPNLLSLQKLSGLRNIALDRTGLTARDLNALLIKETKTQQHEGKGSIGKRPRGLQRAAVRELF